MACRDAIIANINTEPEIKADPIPPVQKAVFNGTLYFGVDSPTAASKLLQHNLTQFEWVTRNKVYPNFWGRYIGGENSLTREEKDFLHNMGCKVVVIYNGCDKEKIGTEEDGAIDAKKAFIAATELGIQFGTTIFLEVPDAAAVASPYLLGYAKSIISDGYIPGFYANTDAKGCDFSHQFSNGFMANPELFSVCKIWAVSPGLPEFFETANAHTIHPDEWKPHCPSCITRDQVAIWQYGQRCHQINDDNNNATFFNVNLIKDAAFLVESLI